MKKKGVELDGQDFVRLANNFYNERNIPVDFGRIILDSEIGNYIATRAEQTTKKYKVAFTFICLNPLYWEFAFRMVQGARQFFLPGHTTDFLFWTDIPEKDDDIRQRMAQAFRERGVDLNQPDNAANFQNVFTGVSTLRKQKDIQLFPTEPIEWPFPTLLRYNLFLQQEEKLKDYDYIFYCDVDMMFVNVVGDEILGEGLTAAQHPMYAIRKEYYPPYEPNKDSEAYIPRPGKVVTENGKQRFVPLYYAGGFQGGKAKEWIAAMKEMRKMVDKDLNKNYIPIWNDESVWNKYLFTHDPSVVLTPSYIYPDSLIKEYYEPLWGCAYVPKLVTLTKWFSLSKEGGQHVAQFLNPKK
jgi:hypothetical protein